jgi:hypothetical protein
MPPEDLETADDADVLLDSETQKKSLLQLMLEASLDLGTSLLRQLQTLAKHQSEFDEEVDDKGELQKCFDAIRSGLLRTLDPAEYFKTSLQLNTPEEQVQALLVLPSEYLFKNYLLESRHRSGIKRAIALSTIIQQARDDHRSLAFVSNLFSPNNLEQTDYERILQTNSSVIILTAYCATAASDKFEGRQLEWVKEGENKLKAWLIEKGDADEMFAAFMQRIRKYQNSRGQTVIKEIAELIVSKKPSTEIMGDTLLDSMNVNYEPVDLLIDYFGEHSTLLQKTHILNKRNSHSEKWINLSLSVMSDDKCTIEDMISFGSLVRSFNKTQQLTFFRRIKQDATDDQLVTALGNINRNCIDQDFEGTQVNNVLRQITRGRVAKCNDNLKLKIISKRIFSSEFLGEIADSISDPEIFASLPSFEGLSLDAYKRAIKRSLDQNSPTISQQLISAIEKGSRKNPEAPQLRQQLIQGLIERQSKQYCIDLLEGMDSSDLSDTARDRLIGMAA